MNLTMLFLISEDEENQEKVDRINHLGTQKIAEAAKSVDAKMLIEQTPEKELADILYEYGDVKKSYRIAHLLKETLPKTTFELRDLISNPKDIAPVFQALRIAVNDEMGQLKSALHYVHDALRPNGRCVCVTFHSLEDRKMVRSIWQSVFANK